MAESLNPLHSNGLQNTYFCYSRNHTHFWSELPQGGLVELNARSINLNRILRTLTDFAMRSTAN